MTSDEMGGEELPVLVGAGKGERESLLLVGRVQDDGTVRVRRWSGADWSAAPESVAERADALFTHLESAQRTGRSLNQSLYSIRLWLQGHSVG